MLFHKHAPSATLSLALALLAATIVWFGFGASGAAASAPCPAADGQKAVAAAALDALWSGQDKSAVADYVAGDFLYHEAGSTSRTLGPRGAAFLAGYLRSAFPDLSYTVDEIVAEGDSVAVRWTAAGTQSGAYGLVAPTGAKVSWSGITIFKLAGGKVSEAWVSQDWRGLEEQLGTAGATSWGPAYYR